MPFRSFVGYRQAELEELKAVLKERPDDPIGNITILKSKLTAKFLGLTDADDEIKSHRVYSSYQNTYNLSPKNLNWHINITLKIGKENIPSILEEVLNCFFLPFLVRVDFFAIAESNSK